MTDRGLQSLAYLLPGPLQKVFADLCFRAEVWEWYPSCLPTVHWLQLRLMTPNWQPGWEKYGGTHGH